MSLAQTIAKRMLERRRAIAAARTPAKPPSAPVRVPIAAHKGTQEAAKVGTRVAEDVPPRRPEPDIRALVESFAPPPATPAPPPAVLAPGFRGSCKAIDAATGRTCKLPAHPENPDQHRSERGPFLRVAAPGTTSFPLRQALDAAALHQAPEAAELVSRKTMATEKQESRDRLKAGIRLRKSAHAGDATSTGLRSDDAPTPTTEAA